MSQFSECESAESGNIAMSLFERAQELDVPYDLMTLDIEMPEINGIDVLKRIRLSEQKKKIAKNNQIRILIVTSHSDKDRVKKCIDAGCDNYIVKPFDKDLVILKLQQLNFCI